MLKRMSEMYCDTFSLYLITFHWSEGCRWALWTDDLPQCSFMFITTSFSPCIVQYYLRLRGQGENISLPCLVTSVGALLSRGPPLCFWTSPTFIFMVRRAFVSHCLSLNGVCCGNNKCIRYCQTIWALYYIVWHFQCTELKALKWP